MAGGANCLPFFKNESDIKKATRIAIYILTAISVALLIVSFFVPPTGVIDGSVLAAVGEMFGFSSLLTGLFAMEKGVDMKVTHGNTIIETNNDE